MVTKKFDTKVQYIKYKVLKETARQAWEGTLAQNAISIPKIIVPGKVPTMRCCVYKERAILTERVRIVMDDFKHPTSAIEVIDIACDECPAAGYEVTDSCRGCLAHNCEHACHRGAISFDHRHVAHIDKTLCVECGMCAKACQFSAIINRKRPCQIACKAKAISIHEDNYAAVDENKCVSCGACVYQCPFGAIMDKSYILSAVEMLKSKKKEDKIYAVVAPSIASQFSYAKIGQVVAGLKSLGFHQVVEAALGADMVAYAESKELAEKGFLISSCCPAFVDFVEKNFPNLVGSISNNLSPMATISKFIKEKEPKSKVVFIGPCTAKKMEIRKETVKPYVDLALTFEELQALFDSRDIDLIALNEDKLDNASYFGRVFARSGGLTEAVRQGLKEHGYDDFEFKPCVCNGLEECRLALMKKSRDNLDANFIEGMACVGGCVGGAGCLSHSERNRFDIDKHGKSAVELTISQSVEGVNNKIE